MLRKIRIALALAFFAGLSLLFLDFTGFAHHWFSWMAKVQALEAVLALNVAVIALLVVLTLVFGRIYCSVICPLGILQDGIAWLGKKTRKNRYSYSPALKWLRYGFLVVFMVALVAHVSLLVQLLAPYSAFGRIVTALLKPLWETANNGLAAIAEHFNSYAFYSVDVWMRSLPVLVTAALTLAVLAFLAWRHGRTYCNTVCPVGTVLSLLSRCSLLKVRFDADKCRSCSLCSKQCKAACIDFKTHSVDYSRCIACGDCLESCKFGALRYGCVDFGSSRAKSVDSDDGGPADTSRRSFLLATALATTAAMARETKKTDGGLAFIEQKAIPERATPLTPPGSLSAQNMRTCGAIP